VKKLTLALLLAATAFAADPFYLGIWKIDSAAVAPWWTEAGKPDAAESKSLVGKTVTITPAAIQAPGTLACKGPKYRAVDVPAEGLFQGAFDEMRRRDPKVDPAKLAATLGFKAHTSKALQTGCANELDLHFIDTNTALVGLNDFVYTLKRQ
jgi:hypothetical protein